jgi:hypothetical protein
MVHPAAKLEAFLARQNDSEFWFVVRLKFPCRRDSPHRHMHKDRCGEKIESLLGAGHPKRDRFVAVSSCAKQQIDPSPDAHFDAFFSALHSGQSLRMKFRHFANLSVFYRTVFLKTFFRTHSFRFDVWLALR